MRFIWNVLLGLGGAPLALAGCREDVPVGAASLGGGAGEGGVAADPLAGEVLASEQSPGFIAVDRANVYWTNALCDGGGSVMKVPIDGGAPVVLASGQDCPLGIAVDDTSVYWTNNIAGGSVMKAPIAGGPPTVLVPAQHYPSGIAVDATDVYWTTGDVFMITPSGIPATDGTVQRVPRNGGAATVLVSGLAQPSAIAVNATDVFFTASVNEIIEKVPLGGGAPVTLASVGLGNSPGAIALDGMNVYTPLSPVDFDGCHPARIPLDGGPAVLLGTSDTEACDVTIRSIATDGVRVYYPLEEGDGDGAVVDLGTSGFIKSVPVTDGVPVTLAAHQAFPDAIAIDATSVYWADGFDGTIRKTAK
jgi:hypothetical protein